MILSEADWWRTPHITQYKEFKIQAKKEKEKKKIKHFIKVWLFLHIA